MAFHIRRVLVVEGNEQDRPGTIACLKEFGRWTVTVANSADELVRVAAKNKPDVVLIGDALPDATTIQLVERLRMDPQTATLNVVVMAAGTTKDLSDLGRATGAQGVIRKPVGADLPDQIRKIVGADAGTNPDVLFRGK